MTARTKETPTSEDQGLENRARREIARRFVALFKEFLGRGPTRARAFFDENLVLVLLEDTLTKGERTLAEKERVQLVREMRRTFQGAMRDRVESIVTEETGRKVIASLSDHSVLPDFAIEAFVLDGDDPGSEEGRIESLATRSRGQSEGHKRISRGMVALFKEYVGRGPTHARTFVHDDLVAILLRDTLTKAELTLAREDRESVVREIRRHFQGTMRDAAIAMVEQQVSNRVVRAFLSDNSVHPDYAIEAFLLADPDEIEPAAD